MSVSVHGKKRLSLVAVLVCALAIPSMAWASGFSVARFGGEHGHPTTSNATAIYYNPAGLVLNKGTHIFLDGTLVLRSVTYERPASAISNPVDMEGAEAANAGEATLFNTAVLPFMGIASDFGTDWFAAGLALYAPFGGSATWDENDAYRDHPHFPGAVDGVQRWYSIEGTIRSLYLTAATAFHVEDANLSLGLSLSGIKSEINSIRARNAGGSDDLVASAEDPSLIEGRALLDAAGYQVGFGAGLIWQPLPDELWLGLSYTSKPNVSGGMELEGELTQILVTAKEPKVDNVKVSQDLPDIYRFGARMRPSEKYELRMFADYTRWSALEVQCVLLDGEGQECAYSGTEDAITNPGGVENAGTPPTQALGRFWKDAFGVRLGGSYWFLPELETLVGVGYDSSSVPVEVMDPALFDMEKMTASLGARWKALDSLALGLTFTQVIYFEVDTEGKGINSQLGAGLAQPGNDGVYNQSVSLINFSTDISF